jgi:hypothetical protein
MGAGLDTGTIEEGGEKMECEITGYRRLGAIVLSAVQDVQQGGPHAAGAIAFLKSVEGQEWLDLLDIDPNRALARLGDLRHPNVPRVSL